MSKKAERETEELTEILQLINSVWREWLFNANFFNGNHVTSKDIDTFVGSLSKLGYQKGIFITTSKFTKSSEHKNITFIDGRKLSKLITNIL